MQNKSQIRSSADQASDSMKCSLNGKIDFSPQ